MANTETFFLIGKRYQDQLQPGLARLGIHAMWLPDNPNLAAPVQGHADLSALVTATGKLILAPYLQDTELSENLSALGYKISFAGIRQCQEYPYDVQLSICQIGNKYLVNPDTVCKKIIEDEYRGLTGIRCRQGYTRCSVFALNDHSVITSDNGISQVLLKNGIEVLKLKAGMIDLPGYSYGFIGGAGFMYDQNHVVFSGKLKDEMENQKLEQYFEERNIEINYLTDQCMFDFGGAVRVSRKNGF